MSQVLVVNCGSSSIKYQLVDVDAGTASAKGLVEKIGEPTGRIAHSGPDGDAVHEMPIPDHEAGLRAVLDAFDERGPKLADAGLVAVGHRVVHGGSQFSDPVVVDDEVVAAIDDLSPLAPLHNPANLVGVQVARKVFPDLPQVVVFDTAFHQTLPPAAYTYAIDKDVAATHRVRRYGFHGTSHAYVSRTAAAFLGRPYDDVNTIVLHIGNGASASAVLGGHCVETSMGLTPLDGLVMGTRSGEIDPGVLIHLQRVAGLSVDEVDSLLNKRSGLLGLAGSNDMRDVWKAADEGSLDAAVALDVYAHRLKKYVGAYTAVLGRVDAVAFTAGAGENDVRLRAKVIDGLGVLGMSVDPGRNAVRSGEPRAISPEDSPVAVLVVPTNEELEIATQAAAVVSA